MVFLARWARRLSWQETAASFDVSWEAVYRSVRWIVAWGLEHRVLAGIRVVVSDMWRPYLAVVRKDMSQAVQILDRFHLTALLNKAVDLVRRGEGYALRGKARGQRLKKTRWLLLKPRARVRGKARERLDAVIHSKLRTHEALILNWFAWKKEFSSAAVEGLNNKARVVTRRSYGFHTDQAFALYRKRSLYTIG